MRIITISREFGSGGRELGKRLADILGYNYYDREIITEIAERQGLDEGYVERALENHAWQTIPLTYRQSFYPATQYRYGQTQIISEQRKVIEAIAKQGENFVIIGRNADVLLKDYNPFNIFVCADMQAKICRCIERASAEEKLTERQIAHKIRQIEKNRSRTREMISGEHWRDCGTYHLTVNTTDWSIKDLAPAVADFANRWFEKTK